MLELGRVQKTIFVARYLRDRDLQREIEEGLSLIEAWNRVNGVIFYGKSSEFATNRREQQELGMLSLHILQAALVYVNTLMIQDILAGPEWARRPHPRGPSRPDALVLGTRPALRRSQAQHDQTPCPHRRPDRRDQRRVELSGRQTKVDRRISGLLVTWCRVP